jgi:glycosyltransferase involved in cell wall biosynthesis
VPEETGFLFRVGDRAALARVTHRLLDDPDLAQRLGQAAQRRMREHFSVAQMVARHVALYDRLLASR